MKNIFKRIVAYFIDIMIITVIVSLLTTNNKVNFQYKEYSKQYNNYNNIVNDINKYNTKMYNLEQKYKKESISKKKYQEKKQQYNKKIEKLNKESKPLLKKIQKNSAIYYVIYFAFVLGYFGIFQYSSKGQTLGKRFMKIKIVNNNENKNLALWQLLVRSIILYNLWITALYFVFAYILNNNDYYRLYSILNSVGSAIQLATAIMVVMTKDGRGLHDFITNTKVIYLDNEGNEVIIDDDIIEAEIIEENKKKKKVNKAISEEGA